MATQSHKRLALAIIDFLNTSVKDGTLSSEDSESIEIATSCIGEAFHVDINDKAALTDAIGTQNLLQIYSVFEKLKGKSTASTLGSSSASEARPASPQVPGSSAAGAAGGAAAAGAGPSAAKKEEAEALKALGNAAMQKKDYPNAIGYYTQALEIIPLNPIYLSNRAAAYSGASRHEEAKNDAEMAVAADPKYTKAWSRLGLARFALGDAKGSMEAYKQGIDAEGSGGSDAMKKGYETAKRRVEEEGGLVDEETTRGAPGAGAGGMPDLSSLASMLGGGGAGGAGGGGMPDIGALLQNPMMRQMASNLMSNPQALEGLMSNPRLREMAENFGRGGGGGMPDIANLMQDPSMQEMARNFMGGMGRGNPPR